MTKANLCNKFIPRQVLPRIFMLNVMLHCTSDSS